MVGTVTGPSPEYRLCSERPTAGAFYAAGDGKIRRAFKVNVDLFDTSIWDAELFPLDQMSETIHMTERVSSADWKRWCLQKALKPLRSF